MTEEPETETETETEPSGGDPRRTDLVRASDPGQALPVLARATAGAWLRAAAWGAGTTLRIGAQIARAASDPDSAAHLYDDLSAGLRGYAREFLGIERLDEQVRVLRPLAGATLAGDRRSSEALLRERGSELLRAAADVDARGDAHPAYARILTELAPDEARILRLLATSGPQAVVDVRAANLVGLGSQLIAPSLNMVASTAGLLDRDHVPLYLANLSRLGLVALSDTEIDDRVAYQVLEAQPDVLRTIKQTQRARTVHRSIELTAFGADFCAVCLPQAVALEQAAEAIPASGAAAAAPPEADDHPRTAEPVAIPLQPARATP